MIFITFVLIVATYFVFAFFAGNINTFFNIDSIIIVLLGFILSSLSVSLGRKKLYFEGIKQMFRFSAVVDKNNEISNLFKAVAIMTVIIGIGSTAQGLISCSLIENNEYSLQQIISFASFTTVYALIFAGILLVPIINLYKEK
jgi:hypothetical protein